MTGRRLTKVATLESVRELTEGAPVELWLTVEGRVVLRAYNECGNAYTEVDILAAVDALSEGPWREISGAAFATI